MITITLLTLATEKTGGLFDLDGTLPLIILQFVLLMIILNKILYQPLINISNERNSYADILIKRASLVLIEANELNEKYDLQLAKINKYIINEIPDVAKLYQATLQMEIRTSKDENNDFLKKFTKHLEGKRVEMMTNLKTEINLLSDQIVNKLIV